MSRSSRRLAWPYAGLLAVSACGDAGGGQDGTAAGTTATTSADSTGTDSSGTAGTDTSTSTDGTTTDSTDSSTGTDGTDESGSSTGDVCGDPECKLNGAFGFHVRIPVTWEAAGPVAAGAGDVRVTLRAVLGTAGTHVSGSADVCEFLVPWYLEEGGNEKIDLDWRDAEFPFAIPEVPLSGTTCGSLPDQTVEFDAAAVQIGVDLAGPINGDWPLDYMDIPDADHDADGRPAFTVLSGNGQTTSPAPLDMGKVDRAHFVYMATRVVAQVTGTLSDCDTITGEADVPYLDSDVVACRVCQGDQPADCVDQAQDCTQGQIEFLNGYIANYETGEPTFKMARVDPNLDCAAIATYF